MNIYFWKEVTNRFQRVSTQIIYVNLILLSFSDTVVVARFFLSSILFPTDRLKSGGLRDAVL